jgi:hypothetical protein
MGSTRAAIARYNNSLTHKDVLSVTLTREDTDRFLADSRKRVNDHALNTNLSADHAYADMHLYRWHFYVDEKAYSPYATQFVREFVRWIPKCHKYSRLHMDCEDERFAVYSMPSKSIFYTTTGLQTLAVPFAGLMKPMNVKKDCDQWTCDYRNLYLSKTHGDMPLLIAHELAHMQRNDCVYKMPECDNHPDDFVAKEKALAHMIRKWMDAIGMTTEDVCRKLNLNLPSIEYHMTI